MMNEISAHICIATPRLLLESILPEHAGGLFGLLADPRVYEYIDDAPPTTVAALAARFASMVSGPPPHRANERWVNVVVKMKSNGTLIGRLEATVFDGRAEVAYLVGPEFWGKGYAIEGMSAFQDHLRQAELVSEFWATTDPHNTRSIRLLGNLGYEQQTGQVPRLSSYEFGDLVFVHR
jgi:RimJ/RimL family protein N-acetyltransferase